MRDINEISYVEFFKTMRTINTIAREDKCSFEQMFSNICRECRLTREMDYIFNRAIKEMGKLPKIVFEHRKVIIAMWLLLNDTNSPNSSIH